MGEISCVDESCVLCLWAVLHSGAVRDVPEPLQLHPCFEHLSALLWPVVCLGRVSDSSEQ